MNTSQLTQVDFFSPNFHIFSGIQSSGGGGDIRQQTQANTSQLEMAVVSGRTQQQRPHEVHQPQPRQEESPGVPVGGGGGGGRVPDPYNSVQEVLKGISNSELGEDLEWSCLPMY